MSVFQSNLEQIQGVLNTTEIGLHQLTALVDCRSLHMVSVFDSVYNVSVVDGSKTHTVILIQHSASVACSVCTRVRVCVRVHTHHFSVKWPSVTEH